LQKIELIDGLNQFNSGHFRSFSAMLRNIEARFTDPTTLSTTPKPSILCNMIVQYYGCLFADVAEEASEGVANAEYSTVNPSTYNEALAELVDISIAGRRGPYFSSWNRALQLQASSFKFLSGVEIDSNSSLTS